MKKTLIALGVVVIVFIMVALFNKSRNTAGPITDNNPPPVIEDTTGLIVENVHAGDMVSSPLQITGYVNGGGWGGFEGQVGTVTLQDAAGNQLDIEPLTATTEWMTTTVRFEVNLEFNTTATEGKLVFKNENASGEPSRDKIVTMPVKFASSADMSVVKAFFGNSKLDPKVTCEKVFALTRTVPKTEAVGRAALEALLKGPEQAEKEIGYETSINAGVKINSLTISDGVAKVDFNDVLNAGVAGSCRVGMIRAQIEQTLKQFPSVKSVVISVNGKTEDILQP